MTEPTLQSLLKRLDHLTAEFQTIREGVLKAVRISENDPEMALARARKVLEYVIRDVFELRFQQDPGTRPLENLLTQLLKEGHLPKRLGAYANYIRDLGNFGTHSELEDSRQEDVRQSFSNLTAILEWYFEQVRPEALAKEEEPSAADKTTRTSKEGDRKIEHGDESPSAVKPQPATLHQKERTEPGDTFVSAWTAVWVAGGLLQSCLLTFLNQRTGNPLPMGAACAVAWTAIALTLRPVLRQHQSKLSWRWLLALVAVGTIPPVMWNSFGNEETSGAVVFFGGGVLSLIDGLLRGGVFWQAAGRALSLFPFLLRQAIATLAAYGVFWLVAFFLLALTGAPTVAALEGAPLDGPTSAHQLFTLYSSGDRLATFVVISGTACWAIFGWLSGRAMRRSYGEHVPQFRPRQTGIVLCAILLIVLLIYLRRTAGYYG